MAHELNIGTINGLTVEQILDMMVEKGIGIGEGSSSEPYDPTISTGFNPADSVIGVTTFYYIGYEWLVVHRDESTVYCITKDILSEMEYSSQDEYSTSNPRAECLEMAGIIPATDKDKIFVDEATNNDMIFLPSYEQMNGGFTYFTSNSRRVALYDDSKQSYWTRSKQMSYSIWQVTDQGGFETQDPAFNGGFRPCIAFKLNG